MEAKLQKWGNSLGLRVPKAFAEQLGLRAGSIIDLKIQRGTLVVRPVDPDARDLSALLDQITPDNVHDEIRIDGPAGKEIW